MRKTTFIGIGMVTLALVHFLSSNCAARDEVQATKLGDERKAAIIQTICADLERIYVYADDAKSMASALRSSLQDGAYDEQFSLAEFAERLTQDLRLVRNDIHLEVSAIEESSSTDDATIDHHEPEFLRRRNFDLRKVEVLDGNVGYLALDSFAHEEGGAAACVAALEFLANTDAMIIDLRENDGGGIDMIQLLLSHLYAGRRPLSRIYIRESDTEVQLWTYGFVAGPRLENIPLWVLVSERTFSAGEGFAYEIQQLERGKIVGEVTAGGAHPTRSIDHPELQITTRIPFARPIGIVTGGNWEGVGVQPDLPVPAEDALAVAHAEALRAILSKESDPKWRTWLTGVLEKVENGEIGGVQ